ncbi:MAG: TAXI family TRAP transporter solute-binding subunit [Oscillospiraceae bacterium]|nr:TAXI family TRAP transporter solute-binding subunit [Oscillospiraceae bacterium]
MKKKIGMILALVLCALLVLAACDNDTPQEQQSLNLIMATGGVAGTYYPLGGAMAAVITDRTNLNVTITSTGASAANIVQIAQNEAQIAIAQNDVMHYAFTATEIWSDHALGAVTNLATLMTLYPETLQIVVEQGSGIYSVEDLRGRRVSIGAPGSGVEANALQVLAAHGLYRDDISVLQLGFADSADAMRDGMADAFFVTAATPNTAIMELSTARDLRILPISGAAAQSLMNDYQFYAPITVTAENSGYTWLPESVETLAVQATLVVSTEMDEQVAYDIVKALIEGRDDIGHDRGRDISAANAVQAISVPLHPGALRFFQEIGYMP